MANVTCLLYQFILYRAITVGVLVDAANWTILWSVMDTNKPIFRIYATSRVLWPCCGWVAKIDTIYLSRCDSPFCSAGPWHYSRSRSLVDLGTVALYFESRQFHELLLMVAGDDRSVDLLLLSCYAELELVPNTTSSARHSFSTSLSLTHHSVFFSPILSWLDRCKGESVDKLLMNQDNTRCRVLVRPAFRSAWEAPTPIGANLKACVRGTKQREGGNNSTIVVYSALMLVTTQKWGLTCFYSRDGYILCSALLYQHLWHVWS